MATKVESNQLTDYWEDAATQTLPDYSGQTSTGFAQDGNPVTGQKATLPGAAWFNIMAAVRVSVILAAGKTPSNPPDPLQFLEALQSLGWMTSESVKTDVLADESVTTEKLADQVVTIAKIATALLATKSQAEAGTADDVLMTPLRVKQAIEKALEEDLPKASETQLGGVKITGDDGITINTAGEIAVDFSKMPTDKFEDILKSIRVPIWLTKDTNFYVNGQTGSDTLDEGRGLQSNKPFKTISACVKFVCDNYNLSRYVAYIVIEPMTYTERVDLQNFTGSGGYISLVSARETEKVTIQNAATSAATLVVSTSQYWFRRIKFVQNITNSNIFKKGTIYAAAVAQSYTNSRFIDCDFVVNIDSSVESETISVRVFWGASFANPIFQGNNSLKYTCPDKYKGSGNAMIANGSSRISVYGGDEPCTLSISGDYSIVVSADSGEIFFNSNGPDYDVNIVVPNNETCTGKRYNASNGGVINTSNNGPEYIPGTIAGGVDSATYSWYR